MSRPWWREEKDPVYAAFCRDVPEAMQEDVLTILSEVVSGYDCPEHVYVSERDQLNACNSRGRGAITLDGKEFFFALEAGDREGTVLLGWEEYGSDDVTYHRTVWALQPTQRLVDEAIDTGRGPFLIWKWDVMIGRPEIAEIIGSYTYDRMVQPGEFVERHWRDKAAAHHFVIVPKDEADETRARLAKATQP